MIIEFSIIGDGTNVEVSLIDNDGFLVDRIYTADHQGGIHYGDDQKVSISARQLFEWVEDSWAPPVIGGKFGHLHPYWHERAERRKARNVS
jgi:hypothetical protein